jgi:hypothetical protein
MNAKDKIQHLLITHLLEHGDIELKLPSGVVLEIGITQEDKNGDLVKEDNYCWVITSHHDKEISLDSFNLGLKFSDDGSIIMLDSALDKNGRSIKSVNVV